MTDTIKPFGWIRDQRGTFEGRQTLDPIFLEGAVVTKLGLNGATYSPLYAAADVAALVRQMRDALEASTRHFGFETLGKYGLRDSMVRGNAHAAIAAADAFLAQHNPAPGGTEGQV